MRGQDHYRLDQLHRRLAEKGVWSALDGRRLYGLRWRVVPTDSGLVVECPEAEYRDAFWRGLDAILRLENIHTSLSAGIYLDL